MRKLPTNRTLRQKTIIEACYDFYGLGGISKYKKSADKIALWIMNRKRGLDKLTEQETNDLWHIKQNLTDIIYKKGIENDIKANRKLSLISS